MTRSPRAFPLAALALVAGCAHAPSIAPSPFDRAPRRVESKALPIQGLDLSITVHNEHWLPMRVWVDWPRDWHFFLGDVPPESTRDFVVPAHLVEQNGDFRLYANPSGSSDDVLTDALDAGKGRQVDFVVRTVMSCSRVRIW